LKILADLLSIALLMTLSDLCRSFHLL